MAAVNITSAPLVPVKTVESEHTNASEMIASSLEQRTLPRFDSRVIRRSIAHLEMTAATSIENSIVNISPRSDSHEFEPSTDPRKADTASIEPLLARNITKRAPRAKTVPDADIDE